MKAVCWCGTERMSVEQVPDPTIVDPQDVVIKTRLTTICGSDLHFYDGFAQGMKKGDVVGHEVVGDVVAVGNQVKKHKVGDRVVVVSVIACGRCWFCKDGRFSLCDNSNPNAGLQEKMFNFATAGIFGYSHLFGGYAGCQAEYVRVPFADVGAFKAPDGMSDEQALACSDIFPTGFMGADLCDLKGGDVVAVWGCGPIGLYAAKSAALLGAEKVIVIDRVPERLKLSAEQCGGIPLDASRVPVSEALRDLTGGRGPDCCIDAVGMEAHGTTWFEDLYDRTKQNLMLETDRMAVLRQIILSCRKGGTAVIMGVYTGMGDKVPLGVAFNKGMTLKMGQQHGPKYVPRLFDYWRKGQIDPGFAFTHHVPLDQAPAAYKMFRDKHDGCIKVALRP